MPLPGSAPDIDQPSPQGIASRASQGRMHFQIPVWLRRALRTLDDAGRIRRGASSPIAYHLWQPMGLVAVSRRPAAPLHRALLQELALAAAQCRHLELDSARSIQTMDGATNRQDPLRSANSAR